MKNIEEKYDGYKNTYNKLTNHLEENGYNKDEIFNMEVEQDIKEEFEAELEKIKEERRKKLANEVNKVCEDIENRNKVEEQTKEETQQSKEEITLDI